VEGTELGTLDSWVLGFFVCEHLFFQVGGQEFEDLTKLVHRHYLEGLFVGDLLLETLLGHFAEVVELLELHLLHREEVG